jgi:hypothetical protein
MTIISHLYAFVVGVDTHAKNHVYSVLTKSGEHVDTATFPTTKAGIKRALTWAGRRTGGDLETLWVIEGIGTYGAILADHVAEAGYTVAEAASMNARDRHATGKDDRIDARRIAGAVLSMDESRLRLTAAQQPRARLLGRRQVVLVGEVCAGGPRLGASDHSRLYSKSQAEPLSSTPETGEWDEHTSAGARKRGTKPQTARVRHIWIPHFHISPAKGLPWLMPPRT